MQGTIGRTFPYPSHRLLALILGATLLGCATNDVIVGVDILSFVDESELRPQSYTVPAGAATPEPLTIEPQTVQLVDGLGGMVSMAAIELNLGARLNNTTGAGDATIQLYLASGGEEAPHVYDTEPIYEGPVTLTAGGVEELSATVHSADRPDLLQLFDDGVLVLGVAVSLDASESPEDLSGTWRLTAMDAEVTGSTELQF